MNEYWTLTVPFAGQVMPCVFAVDFPAAQGLNGFEEGKAKPAAPLFGEPRPVN